MMHSVMMQEPTSQNTGGNPLSSGISWYAAGRRFLISMVSMEAVTVGAAESSARRRSKVAVRSAGITCKALAMAATTWGGMGLSTWLEISRRASFLRRVAFLGSTPVSANSREAAKPYTSVYSPHCISPVYCSKAAQPGCISGFRAVPLRRTDSQQKSSRLILPSGSTRMDSGDMARWCTPAELMELRAVSRGMNSWRAVVQSTRPPLRSMYCRREMLSVHSATE